MFIAGSRIWQYPHVHINAPLKHSHLWCAAAEVTMRPMAWTLLLLSSPIVGWSFQIISPASARPAGQASRRSSPGSSGGTTRTIRRCSAVPRGSHSDAKPLPALERQLVAVKGVLASFVATAFVLAGDPGAVLADLTALPPAFASETTSLQTSDTEVAVVASTKLEGELGAQFQKAQAAGSVQQFDKAKKLYNQVVKYAPGYVYGWSNRANVLIAEGDLQGAVADYDRALELADGLTMSDKWVIYLNRGTTLLALGEDDKAMSDLNNAAKLNNKKDLYTLANRAQAFERRGDWSKALSDYEGAINVQPGNVQPWWIRYGLVLFQEGRDFDSLAVLRRLQSKFEGVGEVQAALTAVQFERGETKDAEQAWRGINIVDQQTYLKGSYLKEQLKWPPRVIESLKDFDRQEKQEDTGSV